ncbi:hypothetical protein LBC_07240 [Campylobacter sp. 19-13652]|nr:hypothetical protein LBC_07240 [Campylobacter sp. 19-13652]
MKLNERQQIIKYALELNDVGALVWDRTLANVSQSELFEFFSFRLQFIAPMVSKELATMQALRAYEKLKTLRALKAGYRVFESVQALESFVKEHFRGEALSNGGDGSGFFEYGIISVDNDGELRNQHVIVNGAYQRLNTTEAADYYNWLLDNQHKIGDIKRYTTEEVAKIDKEIEQKKKEQNQKAQEAAITLSASKKANPNVAMLPQMIAKLSQAKRISA